MTREAAPKRDQHVLPPCRSQIQATLRDSTVDEERVRPRGHLGRGLGDMFDSCLEGGAHSGLMKTEYRSRATEPGLVWFRDRRPLCIELPHSHGVRHRYRLWEEADLVVARLVLERAGDRQRLDRRQ